MKIQLHPRGIPVLDMEEDGTMSCLFLMPLEPYYSLFFIPHINPISIWEESVNPDRPIRTRAFVRTKVRDPSDRTTWDVFIPQDSSKAAKAQFLRVSIWLKAGYDRFADWQEWLRLCGRP